MFIGGESGVSGTEKINPVVFESGKENTLFEFVLLTAKFNGSNLEVRLN